MMSTNENYSPSLTEQILRERGIQWLYHFTRAENLDSILRLGLLPRKNLEEKKIPFQYNDPERYDFNSESISTTIGFPNYKYFWTLRNRDTSVKWVVLSLRAKDILCNPNLPCVFCYTNAANSKVSSQPLKERMSLKAFNDMFEDHEGAPKRETLKGVKPYYPTDPQAEVMVCGEIPPEFIGLIYVKDEDSLKAYPSGRAHGKEVRINDLFFGSRADYKSWEKKEKM